MSAFDNKAEEECVEKINFDDEKKNIDTILVQIENDDNNEFKEYIKRISTSFKEKTSEELRNYFKDNVLIELEQKFNKLKSGGGKNKKSKKFIISKGGATDFRVKLVALVIWIASTLGTRALVIYFLSQPDIANAFGILRPCKGTYEQMLNVFMTNVGAVSCEARQSNFMKFVEVLTSVISGGAALTTYTIVLEKVEKYMTDSCTLDNSTDTNEPNPNPVINTGPSNSDAQINNTNGDNAGDHAGDHAGGNHNIVTTKGGRSRKNKNKKNNKKRKTNRRKRTNRRK